MSLEKTDFLELFADFKDYINTRYNLTILQASEKGANVLSGIIVSLIIILIVLVFLLFGSVSLALYLSEYFNSFYNGFLAVAGIYFFILIIVLLFKRILVKKVFVNMIIRQIFN